MDLQTVFCTTEWCPDKHKRGTGNIVWHSRKRPRCKCTTCGRTFAYRRDTPFAGLRRGEGELVLVVTLVSYGCPIAAIVAAFGMDARTVRRWMQQTGAHGERFHHHQTRRLDLKHVQVDELRLKVQQQVVWVAMAIMVGTRLWLGAACSLHRDRHLGEQMITCIYQWARQLPLVIAFDGWTVYSKACRKLFCEPVYSGRPGRPRQLPWDCLTLAQVVKGDGKQIVRVLLQGSATMFVRLQRLTQGVGVINTAYIERLFATFRGRLALAARRTRHPARQLETVAAHITLVGCLYNFCRPHRALGERISPAMAAGLTDHLWSVADFLWWRPPPYWASTV